MDEAYNGGSCLLITGHVNSSQEVSKSVVRYSLRTQTYFRLSRFSPPKNNVCVSERQNDFRDVAALVFSFANQIT